MEQQEIIDLVKSVIAKRKAKKFSGYNFFNKTPEKYIEPELPDYYPGYQTAVNLAEANKVHLEKGTFPSRLFAYKSPHETDEELTYIKNNYKQTTLAIGIDYINTTLRTFNDGNYSIVYGEDKDEYITAKKTLQDYLEHDINTFGSLENFMKMFFLPLKAIDANGVIAVKNFFKYQQDAEGNVSVSSSDLNEPQPVYYDVARVVAFKEEEYALIDLTSDEIYSQNKKKKPQTDLKFTYELYDKESVYIVMYSQKDETINIEVYDNHNWGKLPVQMIKGIPRQVCNNGIIWQSPFSFASDIMDLVLLDESTISISKKKCAFPTRVYVGRECDFQETDDSGTIHKCEGGWLIYPESGNKKCGQCGGTGWMDRFSPLHDFILNPDGKFTEGTKGEGFKYVAPDPRILEYLRTEISINEEKARSILHLQRSNNVVSGTQGVKDVTATGETRDEKSLTAFIKPISDQTFDMEQFIIEAIAWLRYKRDENVVTIVKPKSFDPKSEQDYIEDIAKGIEKGLPAVAMYELIKKYLNSHYYTEDVISKAFNLLLETDLLMGMDNTAISSDISRGIIAPWQKILHDSGIVILKQLAAEYPVVNNTDGTIKDFYTQEIKDQKAALIARAKELANANKPVSPVGDIAKSILNGNAPVTQ